MTLAGDLGPQKTGVYDLTGFSAGAADNAVRVVSGGTGVFIRGSEPLSRLRLYVTP